LLEASKPQGKTRAGHAFSSPRGIGSIWDLVIEVEFGIAFFAMLARWVGIEALRR